MNQLQALEIVCDKRHAKIMESGKPEWYAARRVSSYLRGWIKRFEKYQAHKSFGNALLAGYQKKLSHTTATGQKEGSK